MAKIVKKLCIIAFWITIWWLASLLIGNKSLFPTPLIVFQRLLQLIVTQDFWISLSTSLYRVIKGIFIGIIIGILLAIASYKLKIIYEILNPFMTVIKATPVASFIILIVLFIGKETVPSIISFLMVMPVVWLNVYEGFINIDKSLKEVCAVYNLSFTKRIKTLYLPSLLPFFSSAVLSSIGLGWKAGIAAEMLYPPIKSIGKSIADAKVLFSTEDVFAWSLVVVFLSLLFEFVLKLSLRLTKSKKAGEKNENN